jgi:hypothetical protein
LIVTSPGRASREDYGRQRERGDRERRISPGPLNIDRYVPGQDSGPPPITVNPLADPATLPFQVGFSYFGEWWRTNEKIKEEKELARTGKRGPIRARDNQEDRDKEKAKIQVAYDAYKEDLQAKMARSFVADHKGEQWFQERYFAEVRDGLRKQLNEFRRGNYSQWEQDLDSGTFDEYSLEGIPKVKAMALGGVVEKEEGETTAANEVLGVGDLVPSRGSDIRDENAFQPTLLIKTIAPHVSRQNLEAFCKEHLGEDEGGFKWLSLSDPNPSKRYHRIGWVMLHPAPETAPIVDRPELKDEEGDIPLLLLFLNRRLRRPWMQSMARLSRTRFEETSLVTLVSMSHPANLERRRSGICSLRLSVLRRILSLLSDWCRSTRKTLVPISMLF